MFKHFFSAVIFLLLITNISFSQFRVGFSGEITSATYGGVAPANAAYQSIAGFGGSLIAEVRIVKNVYLSLQPGFITNGSKIKFGNENNLFNDTVVTFTINQSYFTLPLNLKIFSNRFYVGAGVSALFLSSANVKQDDTDNEKEIKDQFKNYDIVSNFNVGYQIPIGKPYLFFELRYLQGLININNENTVSKKEIYIENFKSKGFSFITGIIYPLK
ncbi:MAG: PorT family protein [Bacteroidota bacterium]|nr:PorT family protein [Bacteroidota bacterium]